MICNKCNNNLPDDSEFCQYCGNKITALETIEKKNKKTYTNAKNIPIKKIIIISASILCLIIAALIIIQFYNQHSENKVPNTPEETYEEVYNWLIDNGTIVNGEILTYTESRNQKGTYKLWAYERNDNILFAEILIDNYSVNGNACKLSVRLDLIPDNDGTTRMYVALDSNSNRAYCYKEYYIDTNSFKKNVPIESGNIQCSYNTPAFNFTYTDKEKEDSLDFLDDINDKSYSFLIEILNWLSSEYAPKLSLTIKDFGYNSDQNEIAK